MLHIGYREVEEKEKLVTRRHRYNLESIHRKLLQKKYVMASHQQQQVISSFTASSTKRHLVLEGPAGTGKTLVAIQAANNLKNLKKAISPYWLSQLICKVKMTPFWDIWMTTQGRQTTRY